MTDIDLIKPVLETTPGLRRLSGDIVSLTLLTSPFGPNRIGMLSSGSIPDDVSWLEP